MRLYISFILILLLACTSDHKKKTTEKNISESLSTQNVISVSNGEQIKLESNSKTIDGITYTVNRISSADVGKIFSRHFQNSDNNYSDFTCLFMDIQIEGENDITNYRSEIYTTMNERIQYLSFMMKDFVKIKSNKGEYKCINSTFDRSYGQIPYSRFFMVFEKVTESEVVFQYDDNYFNKGIINLKL